MGLNIPILAITAPVISEVGHNQLLVMVSYVWVVAVDTLH